MFFHSFLVDIDIDIDIVQISCARIRFSHISLLLFNRMVSKVEGIRKREIYRETEHIYIYNFALF